MASRFAARVLDVLLLTRSQMRIFYLEEGLKSAVNDDGMRDDIAQVRLYGPSLTQHESDTRYLARRAQGAPRREEAPRG